MDKATFTKKVMLWVAVVSAIIIAVCGLCFGKVIEDSLFAEISKWVLMGLVVIGILEGFIAMGLGGVLYHFWYEKRKDEDKD